MRGAEYQLRCGLNLQGPQLISGFIGGKMTLVTFLVLNWSNDDVFSQEIPQLCVYLSAGGGKTQRKQKNGFRAKKRRNLRSCDTNLCLVKDQPIRGDVKIPHSRMTNTCQETLVTCL